MYGQCVLWNIPEASYNGGASDLDSDSSVFFVHAATHVHSRFGGLSDLTCR